jgi:hypothetical protein
MLHLLFLGGDILATLNKKYKCPTCGGMNAEQTSLLYKKRRYCDNNSCLVTQENIDRDKDIKNDEWIELYEYIVELYGHPPTGMMYKQLGEYRSPPYNYTNKGMYLTLKYFHETLGNHVLEGSGLGIIPYVYENAKKEYVTNMEIDSYNQTFESHEQVKIINVHDTFNGIRRMKNRLISFDDIDDE